LAEKNQKAQRLRRAWMFAGAAAICAILGAMAIAARHPAWATPALLVWGTSIPVALFMGTHLALLHQQWFVESGTTSWWQRAIRGYARVVWTSILLGTIVVLGAIWWRLLRWK
jgi:hypothetical protein